VWKLRELVRSQEFGELYYLDSARLNLGLYQSDVNVIFDLAPHDVSIINHVLGTPPVAVQVWASRHAHPRYEDVAYMRLFYGDGGPSANIHVSWLDPGKVRRVTAVGSKKMAVYDDLATEERIRVHDKGVDPPADPDDLTQPPMS
jgi:predicted dehydrogenase